MPRQVPHTVTPAVVFPVGSFAAGDPRLCQRLLPADGEPASATLIGAPFDLGVALGGGRPGAAEGPAALRRALTRFGTTYDLEHAIDFDYLALRDAGDLDVVADDSAETHARLTEAVTDVLSRSEVAVVIGGGNDLTFASVKGLSAAVQSIAGVNVDAHFDVREVALGRLTSGTPFRRIIEELAMPGTCLVELGMHGSVNSRAHHAWLLQQGAACWPLSAARQHGVASTLEAELARVGTVARGLFVSIDLDVFAAAYAPGVSAPGSEGLTPEEGRALAFVAGANPQVRLFELMELNPAFDVDDRTARLAALLLCSFFAGLARRRARANTLAPDQTNIEPSR